MYLSIVILNYFACDKIADLLASVDKQEFNGELIVVDNSENDIEFEKLSQLSKLITKNDCKIIQSDKNGGFSYGTNFGINSISAESTHTYILNPDTVLLPGALEYLTNLISALPDVMISPRGIRMDDKSDWSFGGNLHVLRGRCDVEQKEKPYTVSSEFGTCASVIVPNVMLRQHGNLDEDFFLGGEEWELSVRMRRAGATIITPSIKLYEHEVSGTHKKYGLPFLYMGHRTKVLFMRKCFPMFFPLWIILYLTSMPYLVLKYTKNNDLNFLTSFAHVCKAISKSSFKKRILSTEFFRLGKIR